MSGILLNPSRCCCGVESLTCSPCSIPKKDLAFSYIGFTSGSITVPDASGTLVYSTGTSPYFSMSPYWSGCIGTRLTTGGGVKYWQWFMGCVGGEICLALMAWNSPTCGPTPGDVGGVIAQCSHVTPCNILYAYYTIGEYTCSPFSIQFANPCPTTWRLPLPLVTE